MFKSGKPVTAKAKFACGLCEKQFTLKNAVTNHRLMYFDSRPYRYFAYNTAPPFSNNSPGGVIRVLFSNNFLFLRLIDMRTRGLWRRVHNLLQGQLLNLKMPTDQSGKMR
jgi:hypothetical protein